jgi:hypothetical protein
MKKIIAIIFLFVSINVFAQRKDSILAEITKLQFTPTEIGKPDGEPVAQKIGANGGRLISSDNKVELNIPAGDDKYSTVHQSGRKQCWQIL